MVSLLNFVGPPVSQSRCFETRRGKNLRSLHPKIASEACMTTPPHCSARTRWMYVSVTACEWVTACQHGSAYSWHRCACHLFCLYMRQQLFWGEALCSAGVLEFLALRNCLCGRKRCITIKIWIKPMIYLDITDGFCNIVSCVVDTKKTILLFLNL